MQKTRFVCPSTLLELVLFFSSDVTCSTLDSILKRLTELSGIVCAYHHAAAGSIPMRTIYAFSFLVKFVLYLYSMLKGRK